MISKKKESSVPDEYYSYTDPWRTKDLIWDAYHGFVEHYNNYRMFKSMGRRSKVAVGGLVKYGVNFHGEIRDFIEMIYSKDPKVKEIKRLSEIFDTEYITLSDEDILFLRDFFGKFMVDSGIKNVMHLKDNRAATTKLLDDRYSDIKNGDNNGQK